MGAMNIAKAKRAEGAQKFLGPSFSKNYLVFQFKNALIYMFPHIQNETRKKSAFGSGKGAPFLPKMGRQAEFSS